MIQHLLLNFFVVVPLVTIWASIFPTIVSWAARESRPLSSMGSSPEPLQGTAGIARMGYIQRH